MFTRAEGEKSTLDDLAENASCRRHDDLFLTCTVIVSGVLNAFNVMDDGDLTWDDIAGSRWGTPSPRRQLVETTFSLQYYTPINLNSTYSCLNI